VGLSIDGIDYSGVGTNADLFDVEQVEIFRGPQGTRFGASAMAGMINLYSTQADGQADGKAKFSIGNYQSYSSALAYGNKINDNAAFRVSLQKNTSDGFIDNQYLNRSDTNNIDELASKIKIHWDASENLSVDLAGHYFDIDNGYDAFSLDNNRNTQSDQPGFDQQQTTGVGLVANYQGFVSGDVSLHTSYTDSDLAYGYDEDWTFDGFHDWGYSSTDHYFRDQRNQTVDLRATAKPNSDNHWVAGIYRQNKSNDLDRQAIYGFTPLFNSQLETDNTAIYAQQDWALDEEVTITAGLRVEQHDAKYIDTVGTTEQVSDTLWGGKISALLQVTDRSVIYTSLSRGYKAGGINGESIGKATIDGQDVTADFLTKRTSFEPEVLHSVEFGVKGSNLTGSLFIGMSMFYAQRDNVQLKGYATEKQDNNDATIFVGYIENGSSGSNYGIEADVNLQYNPQVQLFANIGYLKTKVQDFIAQDGTNMHGREQAHAPGYQYNLGAIYSFSNQWYFRANIEGKDEFYYSMSHNAKSSNSSIVNLALGFESDQWDLSIWGRNVFEHDYTVRGFSFGNDPRDGYETNTYTQLGEPARVGATVNYSF